MISNMIKIIYFHNFSFLIFVSFYFQFEHLHYLNFVVVNFVIMVWDRLFVGWWESGTARGWCDDTSSVSSHLVSHQKCHRSAPEQWNASGDVLSMILFKKEKFILYFSFRISLKSESTDDTLLRNINVPLVLKFSNFHLYDYIVLFNLNFKIIHRIW